MTEQPEQPGPEQRLEIQIPPEIEAGVHADFVSIWHTSTTFVLDFASLREPPSLVEDAETEHRFVKVPTRVVARVRLPAEQVFEIMQALARQLSAWERETGKAPPTEPGLPNLG
jgi:hypothetical protein